MIAVEGEGLNGKDDNELEADFLCLSDDDKMEDDQTNETSTTPAIHGEDDDESDDDFDDDCDEVFEEPAFAKGGSPVKRKAAQKNGGRGGRKVGSKTTAFSAEKVFDASDDAKNEAIEAAKVWGGYDFKNFQGSLSNAGAKRTWRCISHADCIARVRVENQGMR